MPRAMKQSRAGIPNLLEKRLAMIQERMTAQHKSNRIAMETSSFLLYLQVLL